MGKRRRERQRQQRRFALWVMQVRTNIAHLWASVQYVREQVAADRELQEHFEHWTQLSALSHALEDADSAAGGIVLTGSGLSCPLPPNRARTNGATHAQKERA